MTTAADVCPCPGTGPCHGVPTVSVHPYDVTCGRCGDTCRVTRWDGTQHLCRTCWRIQWDRAEGWTT